VRARTAVAAATALNQGLRRARLELTGQRDRLAAVAPEQRSRAGALALSALNRILPRQARPAAGATPHDGQGTEP
jgi:hypothetical protein